MNLTESKAQKRFQLIHSTRLADISRRVHFTHVEIESLVQIYLKMIQDAGTMSMMRLQFYSLLSGVLGMYDSFLFDRMSFALDRTSPNMSLETFISAMSLFARGTLQERIDYCFSVYDVVGEGFISRENLLYLLKFGVLKHLKEEVEEAVKDYADRLMKKVDLDRDGMISYSDFCETVKTHPGMLEMMGNCLPDRSSVYAFLYTFTSKLTKQ